MTTEPNDPEPADFLMEFEQAFVSAAGADWLAWLQKWPDAHSHDEMACSLLRAACEMTAFDFVWLEEQTARPQLDLSHSQREDLLRGVCADQREKRLQPCWDGFARFGYQANQLRLQAEHDYLFLGQTLCDKYHVEQLLGVGGLGSVYRAVELDSQDSVAIKTPHKTRDSGSSQLLAEKLRCEATILADFSSPGVPQFVELLETSDCPVMVMQLIEGVSLETLLTTETGKQLSLQKKLQILGRLAQTLDQFHQNGHLHGDIKAANVLVDEQYRPLLIDFNVSRVDNPAEHTDGFLGGTLAALSADALIGVAADIDLQQDIYSLGTLLYWVITGQPMISPTSREEAMVQSILIGSVHRPEFPDSVPDAVQMICHCATSRQPVARFETAGDFAEACLAASRGELDADLVVPSRPDLTAWRLGDVLGLLQSRQQQLLAGRSLLGQSGPAAAMAEGMVSALAMGVSTALDDVLLLTEPLGMKLSQPSFSKVYRSFFYRSNTRSLEDDDRNAFEHACQEAEDWIPQTIGALQAKLNESFPAEILLFELARQAHLAADDSGASRQWSDLAENSSLPQDLYREFVDAIQEGADQNNDTNWEQLQGNLNYSVVRFLRWQMRT